MEAGVVWPKNRLDHCKETGLCGHGSPAFKAGLIRIEGEPNGHESISYSHLIRIFAYIESIDGQLRAWCLVEVILKPVHDVSFEELLHLLLCGNGREKCGAGGWVSSALYK